MRTYIRASPRGHPHDRIVLVLACAAQFMVVLDVSVVNVALPSIGRALDYSPVGLQWVVNAYVLTFAGFLLLGGRAADLYGRLPDYFLTSRRVVWCLVWQLGKSRSLWTRANWTASVLWSSPARPQACQDSYSTRSV